MGDLPEKERVPLGATIADVMNARPDVEQSFMAILEKDELTPREQEAAAEFVASRYKDRINIGDRRYVLFASGTVVGVPCPDGEPCLEDPASIIRCMNEARKIVMRHWPPMQHKIDREGVSPRVRLVPMGFDVTLKRFFITANFRAQWRTEGINDVLVLTTKQLGYTETSDSHTFHATSYVFSSRMMAVRTAIVSGTIAPVFIILSGGRRIQLPGYSGRRMTKLCDPAPGFAKELRKRAENMCREGEEMLDQWTPGGEWNLRRRLRRCMSEE